MVVVVWMMGDFEGPRLTAGPQESLLANKEARLIDAERSNAARV